MIKVLVVEDEPLIAIDIEQVLTNINYQVTDVVFNAEDAFIALKKNTPDIVMLDINLGIGKTGIDVAKVINQEYQIPFIFLTSHADKLTLNEAKIAKPYGYIVKPFSENDLLAGIEIAMYNYAQSNANNMPVFCLHRINKKNSLPLTEREFEVLQSMHQGKTNQQMANEMFVSVNTIKTHVGNILLKLDAPSRTAALAKARELNS
jgi:DNA-binding NarL/FixJ family response regulator